MPTERATIRGRLLLPEQVRADGVLDIADGRIADIRGPRAGDPDPTPGWIAPGLVDLHCHGGGGASIDDGGTEPISRVAAQHLAHGTTAMLASTVSRPIEELADTLADIARVAATQASELPSEPASEPASIVVGAHLEGPFLGRGHCGAHDPDHLALPTPAACASLLGAASGTLRMITIAPELPGAADAASLFAGSGVLVAAGHTDADADTFAAALAGPDVTSITHLCNGMAPMHHREPGPVGAALQALRQGLIHAELIADGQHLDDRLVRLLFDIAAPGRLLLVSDAMASAGMPDGSYRIGQLPVTVTDSVARTESGSLAGSTAHLADVVRRTISHAGVEPLIAVAAATRVPADLIGLADRGRLSIGSRADLVVFDDEWRVARVALAGRWSA